MPAPPTVIITSGSNSAGRDGTVTMLEQARELARSLAACNMPIVLVTNEPGLHPAALSNDASLSVCVIHPHARSPLDQHIEALIEGVLFSARSPGWVWVPADTPMLRCDTVSAVADKLGNASLTHAEHDQRAGVPLGIGAELYSEVIHLCGYTDLLRLRSRYPAVAVPTHDPGVLMSEVGRVGPAPPAWQAHKHLSTVSR